jgi:hypothetical protein
MNQERAHDPQKESPEAAIATLMSQTDEELAQIAGENHNIFSVLYCRHVISRIESA